MTATKPSNKVSIEFPEKIWDVLKAPSRYKVLYGGRGSAKSWNVARQLLLLGLKKPLFILCVREFQKSIKQSVHRLLKSQIAAMGLTGYYDVKDNVIRGSNGTEFIFEGIWNNENGIRSYESVDIAWVEEANNVSKNSWQVLLPTIRKKGSEVWLTFNPEFEDDDTYQRFVLNPPPNTRIAFLNWRDNPFFMESELPADMEHTRLTDIDEYEHVWEGQLRQWLTGAMYAEELRAAYAGNRITTVKYDPHRPVSTVWDIGRTDDTALWFYQQMGDEIHLLECESAPGGTPASFASRVLGREVEVNLIRGSVQVKRTDRTVSGCEHRQEYEYENHWLPHDAYAERYEAHGKSTAEQFRAVFGAAAVREVPRHKVNNGIKAARSVFPVCWFDADKCAVGLKALRKYRRELQRDTVSLKPQAVHDWASHASDAFRYLAAVVGEFSHYEVSRSEPAYDYGLPRGEDYDSVEMDWYGELGEHVDNNWMYV